MKLLTRTYILIFLGALLAHCSDHKNPVVLDFYVSGILDELWNNDYHSALANFVVAETYDPDDPYLKEEIARVYLMLGNPAQGYVKAKEALLLGDKSKDLYIILARAAAELGRCSEAGKYFSKAGAAGLNYADIFLICAENSGEWKKNIKIVKKILKKYPKNAVVNAVLGELYRNVGDYEKAKKYLFKAISLDDFLNQAYISIINTYIATQNYDSALIMLDKYVRLFPWDEEVKRQYIEKLAVYGKYDRAIKLTCEFYKPDTLTIKMTLEKLGYNALGANDYYNGLKVFKKLIEIDDADAIGYYFAGKCYDELWCSESAVVMYRCALDLSPDCEVYTDLALVWARLGEIDSLFESFTESADLCADSASYWHWMGVAFRAAKIYPLAAHCFEEAIRNCAGPDAAFSLADVRERAGFRSDAIAIIDSLLHSELKDSPTLLNYLGYILADDGVHLDYAESLIALALEKEPNNPAYLDSYGWLLFRRGDIKGALKYIKKAAKLYGDDTEIQLHLGDIYLKLGDIEKARHHWWRAVQLDPDNKIAKSRLEQYRDEH